MRVIWTEPALDAVIRAYDYIFEFNQHAAARVASSLLSAGDSLAHLPLRGRSVPRTDMRELVTVRRYIIRYRAVGDEVIILRVRHGAQRPTDP